MVNLLKITFYYFLFFVWPCRVACGILVLLPGIEPGPSAVKAWSPNHWTAREFPQNKILIKSSVNKPQLLYKASVLTISHYSCLHFSQFPFFFKQKTTYINIKLNQLQDEHPWNHHVDQETELCQPLKKPSMYSISITACFNLFHSRTPTKGNHYPDFYSNHFLTFIYCFITEVYIPKCYG